MPSLYTGSVEDPKPGWRPDMQDRRPTRRKQRRFRKRILTGVAFLGFSVLFYQSAESFKQDQIASAAMAAPIATAMATAARTESFQAGILQANAAVAVPRGRARGLLSPHMAFQGPAAVGLAFRINNGPELRAKVARFQIEHPQFGHNAGAASR